MPKIDLVDVSGHQAPAAIAWDKVAGAGVIAAYVRSGVGTSLDEQAATHVARLKNALADFGTYHYVTPVAGQEKQQAALLVNEWTKHGATLAPAADLEATAKDSPLVAAKNWIAVADWLDAFYAEVDALLAARTNAKAIVYTGSWFNQLPPQRTWPYRQRGLWLASYTRPNAVIPWPWDEHLLWQHSGNTIWSDGSWGMQPKTPGAHVVAEGGMVPGFDGEIDCSAIGNATIDSLRSGTQPVSALDFDDVRDRQRALRRLGENPGALDGVWGPGSRNALMHAQQRLNVPVTGAWDAATAQAIAGALT